MNAPISFTNSSLSTRIIYTSSTFARSSLIHLQETGTLRAADPHKNERSGLASCLFFTVLDGNGRFTYDGREYALKKGDCVFIDCKKAYSHETGLLEKNGMDQALGERERCADRKEAADGLWSLQWCHFYGPNMNAIYRKYMERGGQPVFRTGRVSEYRRVLDELYRIAEGDDYVRDMKLHEKLSSLLILLMEDAWSGRSIAEKRKREERQKTESTRVDIQEIKEYLDQNFKRRITLDDLAGRFYINKYYLLSCFKERYGSSIIVYLNQVRVTYIKQQLRFSSKTVEALAEELEIEPTYLSRLFKKVEGVSPSEYRRQWSSSRNKEKHKEKTSG